MNRRFSDIVGAMTLPPYDRGDHSAFLSHVEGTAAAELDVPY